MSDIDTIMARIYYINHRNERGSYLYMTTKEAWERLVVVLG